MLVTEEKEMAIFEKIHKDNITNFEKY